MYIFIEAAMKNIIEVSEHRKTKNNLDL